ncbi:hypothetical protein A2690_03445 [Candidatus Roizmanbacteria bacterium RIFCSPHIGHO2_01_FULL_39_12b]|uniref:Cation-transporting P-type ATPase N-terminal domain-containing protein n=1 Tax=Candidatus Roizmanbacteria bacterium RIFCSPHIGHO2_01_FULL_39_12b TaxID=1802030 RepID=A0A1F7GD60_9BACT|nr:MAG: hypothetical protein A2690_03445 [Candidatus Roizmanbacteria bacterium RIFCSPHIGHO2_01_FULL_39_12b]OGK47329.1 MAG: hypothetical protein A3B46_02230 [Candidatus Roizmanbacteria bacterium RIFCSPLOWO2_01_FULL_39_19]
MDKTDGLSQTKAKQLLDQFGYNKIVSKPKQSLKEIFFSQFKSILIILLIAASVTSIFIGDLIDGVFILLIVVLNGVLGFVQEYKAEAAIAALKKMTVSSVRVVRDGREQETDASLLVPDDIIVLEEGDKVPADCMLLESIHLETNDAALTGESLPVGKDAKDKNNNLIFLGTVVVRGRAKAQVIHTGMNTRFGKIASSLSEIKDEETPLQKKIDVLGKQLGSIALFASAIVFVIGFISAYPFDEMILTSISLAVAAVPEGLPAVITITLAVGMQRMAKRRAILRKLSSIEGLGSTTIIATDKTGTLTKNEMRVDSIYFDSRVFKHNDQELKSDKETFNRLLSIGTICNNASLTLKVGSAHYDVIGDMTEGSILVFAADKGILSNKKKESGTLIDEFAFDPQKKIMSVVWKDTTDYHVYAKGAPESILDASTHILDNGKIKKVDSSKKREITDMFEKFARKGLRVIAFAYKDVKDMSISRNKAESGLIFVGVVGIADPPREEVKQAIRVARTAGIRTIMITGDNELTAKSIGEQIGLLERGDEVVTGKQFEDMNEVEINQKMDKIRIFARTTPEQKMRIVRILQGIGHVVAVTGDGVNDAPALKQADVGVAMGITGTDVAKEVSDMIVTDDNYASIVIAVEEGRTIYDNIKSSIKYLVGCNIGEVMAVLTGMLLGWPLILTPLQLLYVNLVTDGLPAVALAIAPKHEHIMKRSPRSGAMFGRVDILWFIEVCSLTTIITLLSFHIGNLIGGIGAARTLAFTAIILTQHWILLDIRSKEKSFLQMNIFKDKFFITAFFLPLLIQPLLIYMPFLSLIFKVTAVMPSYIIMIIVLSLVLLVSSEIRKIVRKDRL